MTELPLIVIVGQTASGKTAAAIEIAERFGGEIICADSRTVYRGMDLGTAKPSASERARVPHHLLDVVYPDEQFSAARFKKLALQAIGEIRDRGNIPMLVGGTGLYVDAVIFDFQFLPPVDPAERARLNALSIEALQAEIITKGYPMPSNLRNKRHLSRAIETGGLLGTKSPLRPDASIWGISAERELLVQRIHARVDAMVAGGFVEEVRWLASRYGWNAPGMLAPGYKAFKGYIVGDQTLDEAKSAFIHNDLQLAKRQRTWFKRNDSIQWCHDHSHLVESVTTLLNKSA